MNYNIFFVTNFLDRIKPVALVDSGSVLDEGVPVTVSGFGRTSDDNPNPSPILNYVELTTITNEECAEEYGDEFIHPYMVCARGNPHHSSCHVNIYKFLQCKKVKFVLCRVIAEVL